MPDMDSNRASVRLMPKPRNGIAAMAATVTQPRAVTRNAWRRFSLMPSLGQAAMARAKPMKPVTRAAVTNGFQSWSW